MFSTLRAVLVIAMTCGCLAACGFFETARKPEGWPEGGEETWALVARKCSTCHPIIRITQTEKPPNQWKRTAERMARKLGAGISREESARIGQALAAWARASGFSLSEEPSPERP